MIKEVDWHNYKVKVGDPLICTTASSNLIVYEVLEEHNQHNL